LKGKNVNKNKKEKFNLKILFSFTFITILFGIFFYFCYSLSKIYFIDIEKVLNTVIEKESSSDKRIEIRENVKNNCISKQNNLNIENKYKKNSKDLSFFNNGETEDFFDKDIELKKNRMLIEKTRVNSMSFKNVKFYCCQELKCKRQTSSEFCNNHRCEFSRIDNLAKKCQSIKARKNGI
jgi:hypothetical protein